MLGLAVDMVTPLISKSESAKKEITRVSEVSEMAVTPTLTDVKTYLTQINIQHADIVYSQIVLETGFLSSQLYLENKNLFGMKVAKQRPCLSITTSGYAKYNTWQESILDYAIWQTKYCHNLTREQYLDQLQKFYAKDKSYKKKLLKLLEWN